MAKVNDRPSSIPARRSISTQPCILLVRKAVGLLPQNRFCLCFCCCCGGCFSSFVTSTRPHSVWPRCTKVLSGRYECLCVAWMNTINTIFSENVFMTHKNRMSAHNIHTNLTWTEREQRKNRDFLFIHSRLGRLPLSAFVLAPVYTLTIWRNIVICNRTGIS